LLNNVDIRGAENHFTASGEDEYLRTSCKRYATGNTSAKAGDSVEVVRGTIRSAKRLGMHNRLVMTVQQELLKGKCSKQLSLTPTLRLQ
jgi:hypothetical protein